MKKLLLTAILSTILVFLINVLSFYLFNYPDDSEILRVLKYYTKWEELIFIYLAILIISAILSLFLFRKHLFIKKFYISIICFNIILIVIFCVNGIKSYIENKRYLEETLIEFRKNAKNDIKIDKVKYFSQGLLLPPKSEIDAEMHNKIKRIYNKYGLNHKNLGCTISPILTKAQDEYKKITDIYLEKRNGKNWKIRMKKKIDSINKNSR